MRKYNLIITALVLLGLVTLFSLVRPRDFAEIYRGFSTESFDSLRSPTESFDSLRSQDDNVGCARKKLPQVPDDAPYKCGVVFFYHIPSTGGMSMKKWLNGVPNVRLMDGWCMKNMNSPEQKETCSIKYEMKMDALIDGISPQNGWKTTQVHLRNYGLVQSDDSMSRWRTAVEEVGCKFISTVMFRDPLSHFVSIHSKMSKKQTVAEIIHPKNYTKISQLDFFLYNLANRTITNPDQKVQLAMDLLSKHFDYVFYENHDSFVDIMASLTGWERREMPKSNSHGGRVDYSKNEISSMLKGLKANGDTDFANAVKYKYEAAHVLASRR